MKTLLVTLNAKYIHACLAVRYLKAHVKPDFPETEFVEYTIKDVTSHIVAEIYQKQPDIVAFSVYIWNIQETIPILKMVKQVLPNVKIILGGPEVSYDVTEWMTRLPDVDFIAYGEGEMTFHELLCGLQDACIDMSHVRGLAWRDSSRVVINPPRTKVDMNQLASPYQDDEDIARLRDRVVYFETSRGCPFSCQFCLSSIETGVRYFDLERVKVELLRLIKSGIRTIKFVDRTFNLNREYALSLFQFLIDHHRDTVFQFEITGDILPDEIVDFLAVHAPPGLFRFEIGVQSTNDVTNTLIKRRQNFTKLSRTITRIKDAGNIVQHLDLIAGLPEETYASFAKTFNDVFALQPDELQLGFLKMLRGTGLRQTAANHGYVYMDHAPYEIFSNDVLDYSDVIAIKQVEDVLEKYWNDNRMRTTLRYLCANAFASPFDFFQQFGSYWSEQGWQRIGHQLSDLFTRLQSFLAVRCNDTVQRTAFAMMQYEFLLAYRIRPHSVWWPRSVSHVARARYAAYFSAHPDTVGTSFAQLGLGANELEKHVVFEHLTCNPLQPRPKGQDEEQDTLLIVYYPPGLAKGDTPSVFTVPRSAIGMSSAS